MDLLKVYGAKELGGLTYRKLQEKRMKKIRDINQYEADHLKVMYRRCNDGRKLRQW